MSWTVLQTGARLRGTRRVLLGFALLLAAGWVPGCAVPPEEPPGPEVVRDEPRPAFIPNCYSGRIASYLVRDAQQCWFQAAHGRWRTLSHNLHYQLLIVRVAAEDLDDAGEIAQRFVETHGERFSEILIYAEEHAPSDSPRVRRVSWIRGRGFEQLDFDA